MDSIFLQKQIRDNASDLQEFCKDISEWGEEMKQKDKLLSSEHKNEKSKKEIKPKKPKTQKIEEKKHPVRGLDYSAWDKFDFDAECAKIDEEANKCDDDMDEDLSDEFDESHIEQALLAKENGNKFVKCKKWDEAITCYTKAINYYGYDPVFYANRALCHLKRENFKAAESDCTVALQFDKTYVKAYQRRAAAREHLGQLEQARDDILKVFDYEPNNKESKAVLAKLEKCMSANKIKISSSLPVSAPENKQQKPKSQFTISRSLLQKDNTTNSNVLNFSKEKLVDNVIPNTSEDDGFSKPDVEIVFPIPKPAHLRSKNALKRIKIRQTNNLEKMKENLSKNEKGTSNNTPNLPIVDNKTLIVDDLKIIERKNTNFKDLSCVENTKKFISPTSKKNDEDLNCLKTTNKCISPTSEKDEELSIPGTSVQFLNDWIKIRNNSEKRSRYLKSIESFILPDIFKHSLESNTFSDIIKSLAEDFSADVAYEYLIALGKVKRFATLVMFMTTEDRKNVTKVIENLKSNEYVSNDQIEVLTKLYEI